MPIIDQFLAAVRSATRHDDDVHDDDAASEQTRDDAVHLEGLARGKLIAWLTATYPEPDAPIALVLPDGSVVTYCLDADGLSVVGPESIHRLGGESAAESNVSSFTET